MVDKTDSSAPAGGSGRPRAPTITIDSTPLGRRQGQGELEMDQLSDDGKSLSGSPRLKPSDGNAHGSPDLRASSSFESNGSRPLSAHNVSAHQSAQDKFLAVPNTRARGSSFDSDMSGDHSLTSDVTYVNSHHGDSGKAFDEHANRKMGAGDHPILPDDEALVPDKGTESDFHRDDNPFAFAPGHLMKLFNPKSLGAFHVMGGLAGLEKGLRSDRVSGLSVDERKLDGKISFDEATNVSIQTLEPGAIPEPKMADGHDAASNGSDGFDDRKRIFNINTLPKAKQKSIFQLMWIAYNDKVLILLTVAAAITLILGVYQAIAHNGVEWIEGVAIIVAICIVVAVGALNDWQKERQFAKLNAKKDERSVKVVRSGRAQEISVYDILVGDVLMVEPGDVLPVDGIFITGHGVKCDESSATGESDIMKKTAGDEVYRAMEADEDCKKLDPMMISGGRVTEGYGRMLVVNVGIHSSMGKTMLSLQEENEATPLQAKLNGLAGYIAKLGSSAAGFLFIVLTIKFLAQLPNNPDTPTEKGQHFLRILITAVTIIVVAVPEGLPLAVTLALAYATKRMLKDRNLVRVLRSCETMGNATTVCSDKTGTLTQNVMTVVAGGVGLSHRFSHNAGSDNTIVNKADKSGSAPVDELSTSRCAELLSKDVKVVWKDSIAINSTAFEKEEDGKQTFVGSKTETALLDFAREYLGMDSVSVERSNAPIVQMIPFDSARKCMGMVIKLGDGTHRLLVKGASEIMLTLCSNVLADPTSSTDTMPLSSAARERLEEQIDQYASRSLRTIGFIYRDFESFPPKNARRQEEDKSQVVFEDICKDMTFLGLVGIQDPLRPGVPAAVEDCIRAGVFPRMVTGDNITTAKAIATECGIYTSGGLAIEGPEFRKMSDAQQREIIPKLQVLARSSPDDKQKLVKRLKEMGETVAVTGDGTNDAPALKAADVGFSMNIAGTEIAKEASDIILMDDNFTSIVLALMWGRAVNDAVRKFLQFQITVNITAVLLAFISSVASDEEASVLTAVQLLWINLIMDTMAALALATDPPTRNILNRHPDPKSAPLFSPIMWKMIIGQAIFQLIVTLILHFAGPTILGYSGEQQHREMQTLVFNTFTWMQIFNALNNRRLDNKFNIFEGLQNNLFFVGIFFTMIGGQTLIIFFGGWAAFQAERQNGLQWGIALVLGALSLPMGVIIRTFPDAWAAKLVPPFVKRFARKKHNQIIITDEENQQNFNQALYDLKDELAFIRKYKGGRLNNLKFAVQHPKEYLHSRSPSRTRASSTATTQFESVEEQEAPMTPESRRRRGRSRSNSALTGAAMVGIIAGSVAGGWAGTNGQDDERHGSGAGAQNHPDNPFRDVSRSASNVSRSASNVSHPGSTNEVAPDVKSGASLTVPKADDARR